MSKKCANILNLFGFSEEDRQDRIKHGVAIDMYNSLGATLISGGNECKMYMGSYAEGTWLLGSDEDSLIYFPNIRIHSNKENISTPTGLVLTRDEATPAGYVKIQHESKIKTAEGVVMFPELTVVKDRKGRNVLANSPGPVKDYTSFDGRHGPAYSEESRPNQRNADYVHAYIYRDSIYEMKEWCSRERNYNWPNEETRKLFKTFGCFLVPAGYLSSPERHIEWRISFSLQERHLMRHLNLPQYHCFMLLKLINKFIIKPRFGNVLTSYQCKTLLFYTIEEHEQTIWIPDNLISCLKMCVVLLHEWISNRNIPNYFIPKENMFVKMNAALKENYDEFNNFVLEMCNNSAFLFDIVSHVLDKHYSKHLSGTEYTSILTTHCPSADRLTFQCTFALLASVSTTSDICVYVQDVKNILCFIDVVLDVLNSTKPSRTFTTFEETIGTLYKAFFTGGKFAELTPKQMREISEQYVFAVDDIEREPRALSIKVLRSNFQIKLASALAARYCQTKDARYFAEYKRYLKLGKIFDHTTCDLVEATVLLKQASYTEAGDLLQTVETNIEELYFKCMCYTRVEYFDVNGNQVPGKRIDLLFKTTEEAQGSMAYCCLLFENCELEILPTALVYESYRYLCKPFELRSREDFRFDSVAVDPIMYLHYLKFLNNECNNNPGGAAVALQQMEAMLFDRLSGRWSTPMHCETWLSVLGDIFVKKGYKQLALKCFRYSDKLRPEDNAVRFHLMFFLFSGI